MTDTQYQMFLECLDPVLRDACKELSHDISHALPRGLRGEAQVQHVAKALYDAVAADGVKSSIQLTQEQQRLVDESRDALLCAVVSFIDEYTPMSDSKAESVAQLLSMEYRESQARAKTPLYLIFSEIATGTRRDRKAGKIVPSSFCRHSDGVRPSMAKRKDGRRGLTPDDDYSLACFTHYLRCRDKLRAMDPKLNVELLIKYPLTPLAAEGTSVFHINEQLQIKREERTKMKGHNTRNMSMAMRVDLALEQYEQRVGCGCAYDLLQRMEISVLANYVANEAVPEATRAQYLSELESIIDNVSADYNVEGETSEPHAPREL